MIKRRRQIKLNPPGGPVLHHGAASRNLNRDDSELGKALRSLIRGPNRFDAAVFLFVFGCFIVIPGSAALSLISLLLGPSAVLSGPSFYFENAMSTLALALIGIAWLALPSRGRRT